MIKKYLNHKILIMICFSILILSMSITLISIEAASEDKKDVIIGLERATSLAELERYNIEILKEFNIIDAVKARIPERVVSTLAADSSIRYIEEDKTVYALFIGPPGQDVPWGIDRVFGDEEYQFATWDKIKGEGVQVAVLDTGIDEDHEDLPGLLGGVNTVDDTHWGQDDHGHGTLISGVIAARDNDLGVVGVAPESELYSVKVLDEAGSGPISSVIEGIEWAVEKNIPILNMSLGIEGNYQSLEEACKAAFDEGHLLIAAAGNDGGNDVKYPAKYNSVIAVSASDDQDDIADFSDRGDEIELIAPGKEVQTTFPDDEYSIASGTSLSTPHISGIAALLMSADSSLSNTQVRIILQDTAEDIGLTSDKQGYGLSRADKAVAALAETESEVSVVEIVLGEKTALIPRDGYNIYKYEAEVYDQYGDLMEGEEVIWSLKERSAMNQEYVEINENELIVHYESEEDSIKVMASSATDNEIYDEIEVTLKYDFDLISGKLKVVNREDGYKLSLPEGIYTLPVDGERLKDIIIDEYANYDFIEINDYVIFDFTELNLEDRREGDNTDIDFILKDKEGRNIAELFIGI